MLDANSWRAKYQHIQEQLETPELNPSKDNNDFLICLKCSREAPAGLVCCFQGDVLLQFGADLF